MIPFKGKSFLTVISCLLTVGKCGAGAYNFDGLATFLSVRIFYRIQSSLEFS